MSVRHKLVRVMRMGRKRVNMTAKDPNEAQIRLSTGAELKRGCLLIVMHSDIVQVKPMMEGIQPEFGRQIGATKHGMEHITDSLMGMFTRAILM